MASATFYTYAPPSPNPGYPAFLPVTIASIAVSVCVVSNAILAHAAITARNRMAEMILTKRRLWRIMAEKEAAEQAIELKQQFISVASHEVGKHASFYDAHCLRRFLDSNAPAHRQRLLRTACKDRLDGGTVAVRHKYSTGVSCHQCDRW